MAFLFDMQDILLALYSNRGKSHFSAELKADISRKAQEFISDILDSTTIDEDNADPLLTAIIKTDATAAENR